MARSRARRRRGSVPELGAIEFFTRPEQHIVWQVLGFLVRIRAELTIITIFVMVGVPLWHEFGPLGMTAILTITVGVIYAVPASRRYVNRRVWCVITRHRMRACLMQTRTMTHNGRLPFLLWSRPSPVGERVRVWLPAGLAVKDVEHQAAELAAACWARTVRISTVRAQAAFVLVDVIRRDPLGKAMVLTPTVLDSVDEDTDTPADDYLAPLPNRASLDPVTSAPAEFPTVTAARGNGKAPRKPSAPPAGTEELDPEPVVTGFGGVDVSEYI